MRKRSRANTFLRERIPEFYDAYIGKEKAAFDSHQWAGVGFDLACAIEAAHGIRIRDFQPSMGGARADLKESLGKGRYGDFMRLCRDTSPKTLEAACWLAWRYYKAANGESHT